jgi:excisionase family DNA binding protein
MSDPGPLRDVLAASPLLMTPKEAATVLRIGRTTMYALMKAGDLRPVHIGRSCRITRGELERYVMRLQDPASSTSLSEARRRRLSRTDPEPRNPSDGPPRGA